MKPSLVIIGLGNHGASYERTRHNLGFRALDALAEAFGEGEWKQSDKFEAVVQEARIVTSPVLLVKPQTFMNLSGTSVRKLVDFYKLDPASQVLVLSDDIDLPCGDIRIRKNGGPGTHNGLKSVVEQIGEAFPRLRIGLGVPAPGVDLAAWVLSAPAPEEERILKAALKMIPETVKKFVVGS